MTLLIRNFYMSKFDYFYWRYWDPSKVARFFRTIGMIFLFSLPHWRFGYKAHKYRFIESHTRWMTFALNVRNRYYCDGWVWFKLGRFYIRDNFSAPDQSIFAYSKYHLFVWRKK